MMFVLIMMFMGSMMRMMVGGGKRGRWGRYERVESGSQEEIRRLEGALADRDVMLDDLQHRMSELESRLDFTERLLTERQHSTEYPAR
jgi:hypothetical protein